MALFLQRIVVAGPRPTTDEAKLCTCTVDLRWGRDARYNHPRHMRFPLKGHQPYLNPHRMQAAVDAIDAFAAQRNMSDRMLVHCENGVNRTGSVLIAWMCRHGLTFGDAVHHFRELRGKAPRAKLLVWLQKNLLHINP